MLKNVFVDGSDAVVDESVTEKNNENTDPHVVVVVSLYNNHHISTAAQWTRSRLELKHNDTIKQQASENNFT